MNYRLVIDLEHLPESIQDELRQTITKEMLKYSTTGRCLLITRWRAGCGFPDHSYLKYHFEKSKGNNMEGNCGDCKYGQPDGPDDFCKDCDCLEV